MSPQTNKSLKQLLQITIELLFELYLCFILTFNYPIVMRESELYFIKNLRQASPYISQHRDKTVVFYLPSEIIEQEDNLFQFAQDIILLNNLGLRIVITLGATHQINQELIDQNINWEMHHNIRITDKLQIPTIQKTIGLVRSKLEAVFSQASAQQQLPSPIISGNWITAKPKGIIDGVDFKNTGALRNINTKALNDCLASQQICLITPLAYSTSGQIFNLNTLEQAFAIAEGLSADKLIIFTQQKNLDSLAKSLNISELKTQLSHPHDTELHNLLTKALNVSPTVQRVHFISQDNPSAMLLELFTREGVGTLIYTDRYHQLSHASSEDIVGILDLIKPFEAKGVLIERSQSSIKRDLEKFIVAKIDKQIIGCAAVYSINTEYAEIASLVVDPDYQGDDIGKQLLTMATTEAIKNKHSKLFILTTQTNDWFIEQGFKEATITCLPKEKQQNYNLTRNSKILMKKL